MDCGGKKRVPTKPKTELTKTRTWHMAPFCGYCDGESTVFFVFFGKATEDPERPGVDLRFLIFGLRGCALASAAFQ